MLCEELDSPWWLHHPSIPLLSQPIQCYHRWPHRVRNLSEAPWLWIGWALIWSALSLSVNLHCFNTEVWTRVLRFLILSWVELLHRWRYVWPATVLHCQCVKSALSYWDISLCVVILPFLSVDGIAGLSHMHERLPSFLPLAHYWDSSRAGFRIVGEENRGI